MPDLENSNVVPELDTPAKDLLAAFREQSAAPVATRDRLWDRVSDSTASTGHGGAWKAALALLLLGGIGYAAWPSPEVAVPAVGASAGPVAGPTAGPVAARSQAPSPIQPASREVSNEVSKTPAPVPAEPATVVDEPEPPPEPQAEPKSAAREAATAAVPTPKAAPVAPPTELELIARAKKSLAAGRASSALSATREHAKRYPSGMLLEERLLLELEARCELGQTQRVDALKQQFLAKHAASPLADRVRHSCSESSQ